MTYLVIMRRWGSEEDHHYPILITKSLRVAIKEGIEHSEFRGGKYEPVLFCGEENPRPLFDGLSEFKDVLEELQIGVEKPND